jgi:hypothetical protein
MTRRCSLLVLMAFTACETVAGAEEPKVIPTETRRFPAGNLGPSSGSRTGIIRGLGKDALSIEFTEEYREETVSREPGGRVTRNIVLVFPPLAPVEMKLSDDLAKGKAVDVPGLGGYRFADLQPGDHVFVDYHRTPADLWKCCSLCIVRRPKGEVPKAAIERLPREANYKWHEYCQAHQNFEEKGTPIPVRFLSASAFVAPAPREKR